MTFTRSLSAFAARRGFWPRRAGLTMTLPLSAAPQTAAMAWSNGRLAAPASSIAPESPIHGARRAKVEGTVLLEAALDTPATWSTRTCRAAPVELTQRGPSVGPSVALRRATREPTRARLRSRLSCRPDLPVEARPGGHRRRDRRCARGGDRRPDRGRAGSFVDGLRR